MTPPTTSREMLGVIREFFQSSDTPTQAKYDVWCVLTALRGPDNEYNEAHLEKWENTARIRHAAVGPVAYGFVTADPWPKYENGRLKFAFSDNTSYHYADHVRKAARVLRRLGLLETRGKGSRKANTR